MLRTYSWILGLLFLAGDGLAFQAAQYTVVDLGTLRSDNAGTGSGRAINDAGQVAGYAAADGASLRGFRSDPGSGMVGIVNAFDSSLYTLGYGMSRDGQVVGWMPQNAVGFAQPFAFSPDGSLTILPRLPNAADAWAFDVNSAGTIVGGSNRACCCGGWLCPGNPGYAVRWVNNSLEELGGLGGYFSLAFGINEAGDICGYGAIPGDSANHAFWIPAGGTPIDLGTLGGPNSLAYAINDAGQIVGYSETSPGVWRATLWAGGAPINLGSPPGYALSYAEGVNDDGVIVGFGQTSEGTQTAVLFDPGSSPIVLNDLIPSGSGWDLSVAYGVNSEGHIVGYGYLNGTTRAFLLVPGLAPIDLEPGPLHCPPASPSGSCCNKVGAPKVMSPLDPVYLFSGEFFKEETDLVVKGRGLDFVWTRKYRSKIGPNTPQGSGWDYSYNVQIEGEGQDIALFDGHSRRDLYSVQGNGSWLTPEFFRVFAPASPGLVGSHKLLFEDTGSWQFRPLDSSPAAGKIQIITDRNQNSQGFAYDAQGRLETITDTLGRPITIAYNADGFIASVTDFTGRQVRYEYYQDPDVA